MKPSPRKKRSSPGKITSPTRKKQTKSDHGIEKFEDSDKIADMAHYDPVHFLHCHGEGLKIWKCTFMPNDYRVASCAGDKVCLVDCSSGKVLLKYNIDDRGENLYALSGTCVTWRRKHSSHVLATAGNLSRIYLVNVTTQVCFCVFDNRKLRHITTLIFHPTNFTWLLCGGRSRYIFLYDIAPALQQETKKPSLLTQFDAFGGGYVDVLNMCFNVSCEKLFLSSTGVKALTVDCNSKEKFVKMQHVGQESNVTDGLAYIGSEDQIATKCLEDGEIVLHGFGRDSVRLPWVSTEEVFMQIACCIDTRVLAAGDDQGTIWLYNLTNLAREHTKHPKAHLKFNSNRDLKKIAWPADSDVEKDNKQNKNVILNTICFSNDGKYLVAGTDTGVLCIWKACDRT